MGALKAMIQDPNCFNVYLVHDQSLGCARDVYRELIGQELTLSEAKEKREKYESLGYEVEVAYE